MRVFCLYMCFAIFLECQFGSPIWLVCWVSSSFHLDPSWWNYFWVHFWALLCLFSISRKVQGHRHRSWLLCHGRASIGQKPVPFRRIEMLQYDMGVPAMDIGALCDRLRGLCMSVADARQCSLCVKVGATWCWDVCVCVGATIVQVLRPDCHWAE